MAFAISATAYLAMAVAATAAVTYTQGKKAAAAQQQAASQATTAANTAADQADQANNRANGKQPDISSMSSANSLAAKGGVGGTMLTGSQGVDPNSLLLGKKTLLGS
jgi:type II secretory pathway pseudopilin PulG